MSTFEQVLPLWQTIKNPKSSDAAYNKAHAAIRALGLPSGAWIEIADTPEELSEALSALPAVTIPAASPLPAANPLAVAPEADNEEEDLDLLPFSVLYRNEKIQANGYGIDQFARPHGVSGRYRKRGPLCHQRFYEKGKGRRFREGYKLTLPGVGRRLVSSKLLALARFEAERAES